MVKTKAASQDPRTCDRVKRGGDPRELLDRFETGHGVADRDEHLWLQRHGWETRNGVRADLKGQHASGREGNGMGFKLH
jgi:hypothetical protein